MIAYRNQSDQFVFNSFVDHFPSLQKFIVFASLFVFCSFAPFPFLFHFLTFLACWPSLTVFACGEQDREILKQERGLETLGRKKIRKHWFCKKRAVSFSSSFFFVASGRFLLFCVSVSFWFFLFTDSFLLFAFSSSAFSHSIPSSFLFCFERHSLCFFCFLHFCIASLRKFSSVILLLALPFIVLHTHTLPLCLQVLRKSSKFPSRDPFLQFLQSQPNFAFCIFQFYFCFRYFYLLIIASCRFFLFFQANLHSVCHSSLAWFPFISSFRLSPSSLPFFSPITAINAKIITPNAYRFDSPSLLYLSLIISHPIYLTFYDNSC